MISSWEILPFIDLALLILIFEKIWDLGLVQTWHQSQLGLLMLNLVAGHQYCCLFIFLHLLNICIASVAIYSPLSVQMLPKQLYVFWKA